MGLSCIRSLYVYVWLARASHTGRHKVAQRFAQGLPMNGAMAAAWLQHHAARPHHSKVEARGCRRLAPPPHMRGHAMGKAGCSPGSWPGSHLSAKALARYRLASRQRWCDASIQAATDVAALRASS